MAGRFLLLAVGVLVYSPAVAHAGMSRVTSVLTEMARMRLQSISFFLAGFLLSCWGVQLLWNWLRRDFTVLPRLGYPKAVGLVGLWGMLFVLVLTMISGARELLTPGAWKPSGVGYGLTTEDAVPDVETRKQQLLRLKQDLWRYARGNNGRFPPSRTDTAIPAGRWELPDASGQQYFYRPGIAAPFDGVPVAWEPEVYGRERWVLFSDGEVRLLSSVEVARAMPAEGK